MPRSRLNKKAGQKTEKKLWQNQIEKRKVPVKIKEIGEILTIKEGVEVGHLIR